MSYSVLYCYLEMVQCPWLLICGTSGTEEDFGAGRAGENYW